jgi:hypothetical protein
MHTYRRFLVVAVWLLLASPAAAVTLTRGPYLQLLTTSSVTIVWNTNTPASCALAIRPLDGEPTIIRGGTSSVCAIAVQDLSPGEQYAYVPLAGQTPLADATVFQADDPSLPFTFLVLGDSGGATKEQFAVRDRMLATPADFLLSTGDMVYETGAAADFNPTFFNPYTALINHLVFWPCLGNHDVATAHGQPWRDAFYTPANNPAHDEGYYSFDFGNAHVAVVDSDSSLSPGSAQYVFLDRDLGASDATWKFVAFHHTIYTSSADTKLRANLVPLFDRHHVDIVFMGHVHVYERTLSLRGDRVVAPGTGTVYVTTGGGGRSTGSTTKTAFTAYAEATPHFTRVAIDGDVLLLQMIRSNGSIRDEMPLVKGSASTTSSTTTTTTLPDQTLVFAPVADAYVDAKSSGAKLGGAKTMIVDASPARIAYLRFVVSGVGSRTVAQATLFLTVDSGSGADSPSAGTLHRVADTSWSESSITYKKRPALGEVLASGGSVSRKQEVGFDATAAVSGDGTYSLALDTASQDDVRYLTREAKSGRPRLVLTLAPSSP